MSHVALVDLAAMLVLGALCWGMRVVFVLVIPADRLPDVVGQTLQYLAPAALASICAVEIMASVRGEDLMDGAASVGVVALALAVAVTTRNLSWTVLAGGVGVLLIDLVLFAG